MGVTLSILIPTVSVRASLLSRLLARLEPQLNDRVEVIVHDSEGFGVGTKCNVMFHAAKGDYVISIDDDDMVPEDYVEKILAAVGPDFIGYKLMYQRNGQDQYEIIHDVAAFPRSEYVRGVSLKCPIKRDIAITTHFDDGWGGDMRWCQAIEETKLIKTSTFIDEILYIYDFWDTGTLGPMPTGPNRENQRDVGLHKFTREKFIWLS
jgi:glycosyltransferase involved in cell wall biosynthesis